MQTFIQWLLGSITAVLLAGFLSDSASVWAFPQDLLTMALFIGAVTATLIIAPLADTILDLVSSISFGSSSSGQQTGSVKWFNPNKGFGFITCDNGDDVFVHQRSLDGNRRKLAPGQRVSFSLEENEKGLYADAVAVEDS
ncbi:MAG: CspA family cold shock protein [Chitinophagales bacterium]|jgi:CspA family cold shock protein